MLTNTSWTRRLNGTIKVLPLGKPQYGPPEFLEQFPSRLRFLWEPPFQISRLPSWYKLALDCYVGTDGTRRFTLVELSENDRAAAEPGLPEVSTARGLALVTSVGGYALMLDRGTVDRDQLLTHDEARLYLQYVEHRREYFGKRKSLDVFMHSPEERILKGRSKKKPALAFPEDMGLDATGNGAKWTLSRFNEEARAAAHTAGIEQPTKQQLFSQGLTAAAKLNPLYLSSADKIEPIVRMALFALPESSNSVTTEQLQYVAKQVRSSLRDHLVDSDEDFRKWIDDPKSDLVRRITRRSDCSMTREQVRRVLLELGWYALKMLGQCIDIQMRAFRDALSEPLTEREDIYFSQLFFANPAFGGLPLLLLSDRYDELSAAIVNVWNSPGSRDAVAVLHRTMVYFAEFMGQRREADKMHKRRSLARNANAQIATESEFNEENFLLSTNKDELFSDIAKVLAVRRGIDCDSDDWEFTLVSVSENLVQFKLRRADLPGAQTLTVPRAEFEEVARDSRDSD